MLLGGEGKFHVHQVVGSLSVVFIVPAAFTAKVRTEVDYAALHDIPTAQEGVVGPKVGVVVELLALAVHAVVGDVDDVDLGLVHLAGLPYVVRVDVVTTWGSGLVIA